MSSGSFLKIQPTELKLPFEVKKQSSCCMQLTNKTDMYVAFKVKTTNPKKYCVRPNTGIVLPGSTCDITVTMQAQKDAPPDMQCKDKFLLQSVVVEEGATTKDITPKMFNKEPDKVVEEFKMRVVYIPANPPSPVPEEAEEGSSPRSAATENGTQSSSLFDAVTRSFEEQSKVKSPEAANLISRLIEEKTSAIQLNQQLRQELVTMSSDKVVIVCQYGGTLTENESGRPTYSGGRRKMVKISKRSTYAKLKDTVYKATNINPDDYDIRMVCSCPRTSQDYITVDVENDEDTNMMICLLGQVPVVNLYIVQSVTTRTPVISTQLQGGFSQMLNEDNVFDECLTAQSLRQGTSSTPTFPPGYEYYREDLIAGPSTSHPYNEDLALGSEHSEEEIDAAMQENSIQCAFDRDDPQWVNQSYANNEWVEFEDPHPDEVIDEEMVRNYSIERLNFNTNFDMAVEDDFKVGQLFSTKKDLVQAVSEWSIRRSVAFKTVKSTTTKYILVCAKAETSSTSSSSQQCLWRLHAIVPKKEQHSSTWVIKKYVSIHTCRNSGREMVNRQLTGKFICNLILPVMKTKLDMTPANIQDQIKVAYYREISYYKAWDARKRALCALFGDWETSYHKLEQYMDAIKRSNPGTVYHIASVLLNEQQSMFDGLFWAFGPSIEGFAHCRPVLSIDGTHLYGKYRGCLLVATGVDGDGGLYPLCFAVVTGETEENWEWFFACIRTFIPSLRRREITWISDRMKGLPRALAQGWRYPHSHRYCLRHIRANFKLKFKSEVLENILYAAGSTPNPLLYAEYRAQLKAKSREADAWIDSSLGVGNEDCWALCKDGGKRFCIMTTNCSESFNGVLKGARALPIQSIVARTFYRLNTYFVTRREASALWMGQFTPSTEKLLGERVNESRHCSVTRFSLSSWEVFDKNGLKHNVQIDGDDCECSCNIPMLNKIPCIHVIKACSRSAGGGNMDIERYVSQWFSTTEYQQSYAPVFKPIPDSRFWNPQQGSLLIPPVEKRGKGRPKSTRLKGAMDDVGREGERRKNKCSKCNEYGHIRSTCKKV